MLVSNPISSESIYAFFKKNYYVTVNKRTWPSLIKRGENMKKFNVCIVGGGSTYTLGFLKSFARLQDEFPLKNSFYSTSTKTVSVRSDSMVTSCSLNVTLN